MNITEEALLYFKENKGKIVYAVVPSNTENLPYKHIGNLEHIDKDNIIIKSKNNNIIVLDMSRVIRIGIINGGD